MLRYGWAALAVGIALAGCDQAGLVDDDGGPVTDAGADPLGDAGPEELNDAATALDAGRPKGPPDGGSEQEADAGADCECTAGPCCDGCHFRPTSHRCAADVVYEASCAWESRSCPGYSARIWMELADQFCSGSSAECDGELVHTITRGTECEDGMYCTGPDGSASCTHVCERP